MGGLEKRQFSRYMISRPAKLKCGRTGKYLAGRTRNVSSGGILLEINRPALIQQQPVDIGIAWVAGEMVLNTGALVHAHVTRTDQGNGVYEVAIAFDQPQTLPVPEPTKRSSQERSDALVP